MNRILRYILLVMLGMSMFSVVHAQESSQKKKFYYAPTRLKPSKSFKKPTTEKEIDAWVEKNEKEIVTAIGDRTAEIDEKYNKRRYRRSAYREVYGYRNNTYWGTWNSNSYLSNCAMYPYRRYRNHYPYNGRSCNYGTNYALGMQYVNGNWYPNSSFGWSW